MRTLTKVSIRWRSQHVISFFSVALILVSGSVAVAQDRSQYAIERAQAAVRDRIWRDLGGAGSVDVSFPEWNQPETSSVANNQTLVRGRGMYARRGNYQDARAFSYEAVVNTRNGRVDRAEYRVDDGGGSGGGNQGNDNVPSWIIGAYRGRNPANRQRMTMTINRNGRVRATYDNGTTDRGTYDNGFIRFNANNAWTVTQSGNDLRARDIRTGRTERLERTSESPGDSDGDDSSDVPRWMVGTFRGQTSSGESELSIGPNGVASIRSISTNRLFTGRYDNGVLTFEFGSFDVTRDGSGIRTIERGNRNNRTSYRRVN